jgi:hypothetical protein
METELKIASAMVVIFDSLPDGELGSIIGSTVSESKKAG